MRKQKKKRNKKLKKSKKRDIVARVGRDSSEMVAVGVAPGVTSGLDNSAEPDVMRNSRDSNRIELNFSDSESHFLRTVRSDIGKIVLGLAIVAIYFGVIVYFFSTGDFLLKLGPYLAKVSGLAI